MASDPSQPKLQFPNSTGSYESEYIPTPNYVFMNWFRWKYVKARESFGKDIYYWHIRHDFDPESRKKSDIEFVRHVILDHDQNPEDPIEKRHFNRAWRLYGREMKYVLGELSKDDQRTWEDESAKAGHPYAYGYADRWFHKFAIPEQKVLYHGVSTAQYLELIELMMARALQQREEYCKKWGLDPETGEKLSGKQYI